MRIPCIKSPIQKQEDSGKGWFGNVMLPPRFAGGGITLPRKPVWAVGLSFDGKTRQFAGGLAEAVK